jgi:hypothetical protein
MKTASWVLVGTLALTAFFAGLTYWGYGYCSSLDAAKQAPENDVVRREERQPEDAQKQAAHEPLFTASGRATVRIYAPLVHQQNTYPLPQVEENKKEPFGQRFFCEAKATDAAIAWFTYFLFIATGFLWWAARNQEAATKSIERAYVKMSHQKPGVRFIESGTPEDSKRVLARITFEIENWGRTPARVTRTYSRILLVHPEEVPVIPPEYREGKQETFGGAFLVGGEKFTNGIESPIPGRDKAKVDSGKFHLIVVGYVDYADIFHKEHRAGFARRYAPEIDAIARGANLWDERNNLVFVNFVGYNYDEERSDGQQKRERT